LINLAASCDADSQASLRSSVFIRAKHPNV
jgi:hypothetical protein